MHIEYEVRVLDIDKDKIIKQVEALGGKKVADFDYKRKVYNFNPPVNKKWIRLRTDGEKTTLTIKKLDSLEIDGTKEMEIEVSDFEETDRMLNELGYVAHTYQESKRTRYLLNGVELDIDTWPYIPTYLEIEGKDEQSVKEMIQTLKLNDDKVTSIDVQEVFKKYYHIDIAKVPEMKFDKPLDKKYYIN